MRRLLLIWLMLHGTAFAAVTCDSPSNSTTEANPQSLSYTVGTTSTSNRVVIAQTPWREEGVTPTGVTFNGVAMTQIGSTVVNTTPNPDVGTANWIMTGVSSGTFTVSASWSGLPATATLTVFTCYGVDQITPVRVGSPNSATANTTTGVSVNIASAAGDLVIDSEGDASSDPSVGAGQTLIGTCTANNGTNFDSCASTEPGAGTVTMSYTSAANASWAIHGFSLRPAGASSSVRKHPLVAYP